MLKFVFLSKIFNLSSLSFETKRRRLIGGNLAIVLTFFLSQILSFSHAQSALFPEQSVSYQFLKSEDSEAVQERQVTYKTNSMGLEVLTTLKHLVREYYPSNIDFTYNLIKKDGGYYADFTSVINPFHLTQSMWATFQNDYEGDLVYYPEVLQVGGSLPDCVGKVKVLLEDDTFGYEEFSLTDRKVSRVENVNVSSQTVSAFVLTSTYHLKSRIFKETGTESLTQWIVPGKGIVKEVRITNGKQITTEIR